MFLIFSTNFERKRRFVGAQNRRQNQIKSALDGIQRIEPVKCICGLSTTGFELFGT